MTRRFHEKNSNSIAQNILLLTSTSVSGVLVLNIVNPNNYCCWQFWFENWHFVFLKMTHYTLVLTSNNEYIFSRTMNGWKVWKRTKSTLQNGFQAFRKCPHHQNLKEKQKKSHTQKKRRMKWHKIRRRLIVMRKKGKKKKSCFNRL